MDRDINDFSKYVDNRGGLTTVVLDFGAIEDKTGSLIQLLTPVFDSLSEPDLEVDCCLEKHYIKGIIAGAVYDIFITVNTLPTPILRTIIQNVTFTYPKGIDDKVAGLIEKTWQEVYKKEIEEKTRIAEASIPAMTVASQEAQERHIMQQITGNVGPSLAQKRYTV
jgi:hypothetical protein